MLTLKTTLKTATSGTLGSVLKPTLFAVLMWAASAAGAVPIPGTPVPITLQTFVVMLAALMLPWKQAGAAMLMYLAAGAVGLPVFLLLRKSVGSTAASMLMMGVMLPFFMFGIYEKNGQTLETVLRQMVETKWLRPRRRPYETDNTYAALEREMRLRKEVKALEEQAKKARR